jgi:hypothetical protein
MNEAELMLPTVNVKVGEVSVEAHSFKLRLLCETSVSGGGGDVILAT